jgi:hypothetical protein
MADLDGSDDGIHEQANIARLARALTNFYRVHAPDRINASNIQTIAASFVKRGPEGTQQLSGMLHQKYGHHLDLSDVCDEPNGRAVPTASAAATAAQTRFRHPLEPPS